MSGESRTTIGERMAKLREFPLIFWGVLLVELIERVAFYSFISLLVLHFKENLGWTPTLSGTIWAVYQWILYLLPVFMGALADAIGYRRALQIAFTLLTAGYLALSHFGHVTPVLVAVVVASLGGAIVKPTISGSVSKLSGERNHSLGFALYYWAVNVGALVGFLVANPIKETWGIPAVIQFAAAACLLNALFVTLVVRNLGRAEEQKEKRPDAAQTFRNLLTVLSNGRFMLFLALMCGEYIIYSQIFVAMPLYLTGHVSKTADPELVTAIETALIVLLQVPISAMLAGWRTISTIVLGFFIAGTGMALTFTLGAPLGVAGVVIGVCIYVLGEMAYSPTYFAYCADLAPPEQKAMYMGFSFLPLSFGQLAGGILGGVLVTELIEKQGKPEYFGLTLFLIGCVFALALYLFDRYAIRGRPAMATESR